LDYHTNVVRHTDMPRAIFFKFGRVLMSGGKGITAVIKNLGQKVGK